MSVLSTARLDRFSYLPKELIYMIFNLLNQWSIKGGSIHTLCLVSKTFNSLATPLLYRHLILKYHGRVGFMPHTRQLLLPSKSDRLKLVKRLSIVCVEQEYSPKPNAYDINLQRVGKDPTLFTIQKEMIDFFTKLLEKLDLDSLHSIGSDWIQPFLIVPPDILPKLESYNTFSERRNSIPIAVPEGEYPDPVPFWKFVCPELHLRSLEIDNDMYYSPDISSNWTICFQSSETLRKLILKDSKFCRFWQFRNNSNVLKTLIDYGARRKLRALEEIKFHYVNYLNAYQDTLLEILPSNKMKSVRLVSCAKSKLFVLDQVMSMCNLTHLSLIDSCKISEIEPLLEHMPCRLQSIQLVYTHFFNRSGSLVVWLPRRAPYEAHSKTLRKLWLNIRYEKEGIPANVEIPLKAENTSSDMLDVETLSKFPVLEFLAIAPNLTFSDGGGGVDFPVIPALRGMYFVNFNIVHENSVPMMDRLYAWFKRAYDKAVASGDLIPELRAVAFGYLRRQLIPDENLWIDNYFKFIHAYFYRRKLRYYNHDNHDEEGTEFPQKVEEFEKAADVFRVYERSSIFEWDPEFGEFLESGEPESSNLYPSRWSPSRMNTPVC